ncbi:MAG TPA: hypothetical protein VI749_05185 [Candidatus Omnitrophota bacterium]|nr:hypothetical protein [Candidatus Omnitrophota bacterium]
MSKSGKKPRVKFNPRQFEAGAQQSAKKDKDDFNFEEFARMKTRGKRAW